MHSPIYYSFTVVSVFLQFSIINHQSKHPATVIKQLKSKCQYFTIVPKITAIFNRLNRQPANGPTLKE